MLMNREIQNIGFLKIKFYECILGGGFEVLLIIINLNYKQKAFKIIKILKV
jgi:hypothetical protein